MQLYPPFDADPPSAGRGCWAWRRRDVELQLAGGTCAPTRGGLAMVLRANTDLSSSAGAMRPAVSIVAYPSVQLHPPFEAPLHIAGRGCWVRRRRDVVQMFGKKVRMDTDGDAVTGIPLDEFVLPRGCCGMPPAERIADHPSVQLYPPGEAPLPLARRGCQAWRRRDVVQLLVRGAAR